MQWDMKTVTTAMSKPAPIPAVVELRANQAPLTFGPVTHECVSRRPADKLRMKRNLQRAIADISRSREKNTAVFHIAFGDYIFVRISNGQWLDFPTTFPFTVRALGRATVATGYAALVIDDDGVAVVLVTPKLGVR